MIARVVYRIVEVKSLAILKLYLNNTEHYSGNPQTLPQQYGFEDCQSSVPYC
jgi:hypothetical protein